MPEVPRGTVVTVRQWFRLWRGAQWVWDPGEVVSIRQLVGLEEPPPQVYGTYGDLDRDPRTRWTGDWRKKLR